uniref:ATP synthase protein 8 n=1 Tax=Metschnikowia kamakouana TaxID=301367 RepID=A0A7D7KQS3_9ASCO|nr:Atp8 [Metschnikowia kamakouana]QMS50958.1 Atp8 [Metschnikowia kamakouana]
MPQLVPFYFLHLLTFGMLMLTILMYMMSKYLLPNMLRLLIARILMMKL